MKKPELAIIFENGINNPERNLRAVNKWMHIVYERRQTPDEMKDAELNNRMFTKYSYFIDEKPFFGNIKKVLEINFEADKNHVSKAERLRIKDALLPVYYSFYNRRPVAKKQLELFD